MTNTSKTLKEILEPFALRVAEDYKALKVLLTQLQNAVGQLPQSSAVNNQIQQAVQALKSELLDGADAQYDTLKELGDKLKELASDETLSGLITQKLTEINQKIETLEQSMAGLNELDLVETYNQAKAGDS